MDVNNWFKNGCNYHEGVILYSKQKGYSINLLRLFLKKESKLNIDKLAYEMEKYRTDTPSAEAIKNTSKKVNPQVDSTPTVKLEKHQKLFFYSLNQLPIELHPLAIKQRNNFQKAISLKLILNEKHELEEGESLKLCIQIEDLFDAIETAQKTLKYYVDHKVILKTEPMNFEDLSGDQRLQRRNNKRITRTKTLKKIEDLKLILNTENTIKIKTKARKNLAKYEEKLIQLELEIQQLTDLINKK